ncbi:hypothetical protein LINPERPRIM_LOCUS24889, partial [Linum perenne]
MSLSDNDNLENLEPITSKTRHRGEGRSGCKAMLSLKFEKQTGKYIITQFKDGHNHLMIP